MIIADYKCGCTWVGKRSECLEYCGKHGDDRQKPMMPRPKGSKLATGWRVGPLTLWVKERDTTDGIAVKPSEQQASKDIIALLMADQEAFRWTDK